MKKLFCDLCKKEIKTNLVIRVSYYKNWWFGTMYRDICKGCNIKIAKFITKLEKL